MEFFGCQTTNLQIYTKYIHLNPEWITYLYFLTHLPNFSTSPVSGNVRVLISLLLSDSLLCQPFGGTGTRNVWWKASESFNPTNVHKNLHRCLTLASPVKKRMCKSLHIFLLFTAFSHAHVRRLSS